MSGGAPLKLLLLDASLSPTGTLLLDVASTDMRITDLRPGTGRITVYVGLAGPQRSSVVEVLLANGVPVARFAFPEGTPHEIIITPKGRRIFALLDNSLVFLDPRGREPDRTITVCGESAVGVAVLRAADRAFVTCSEGHVVEVDIRLRRTVRRTPLGDVADTTGSERCTPGAPALSRNETVLFVPCGGAGRLLYLDRVTLAPFASVDVGAGIVSVHFSRRLNKALVTYAALPAAVVVDVRRRSHTTLQIPGRVIDVTVGGDGLRAYLLLADTTDGSRSIAELDFETARITLRVAVPHWASEIATWPTDRTPVMWWRR